MKILYTILLAVCFGTVVHSEDGKIPSSSKSQGPSSNTIEQKEASPLLTLSEVLSLALENSPEIKAVDAELAGRLADAKQTGFLKNPEVEITLPQKFRVSVKPDDPVVTAKLTQPLSIADFGYRQTVAHALEKVATQDAKVEVYRVLNETALVYYRSWALQQRLEIVRDSERQSKEVVALIGKAIEEGSTPSTEGNIFVAEAIRFGAESKAVAAELDLAQADLIRIAGEKGKNAVLERPRLPAIPSDTAKLLQFAQTRYNIQERLLLKELAARDRMHLAHLNAFPEISPQLIYERERDGTKTIGIGITLPLPLFDWNQAESLRTRGEWEKAHADREALDRVGFERQVIALQRRAIATQERSDAYWDKVIPAYIKAYTLGRQMFEMGQASMLQLWQIQKTMVENQEQALQFTVESIAARTALESAIGGKVEEIE